ncbi:MAG: IS1182 family transposase [Acidobacteriota bacterium]|nr:IS1182 family transposase [Acidobacteriota bacterium]
MLKKPEAQQQELEMVSVESLVPSEHLLRKIDRVVDFSFIHDRVKHLYCENNGRPALEPVVLFKLLLLGYLYGVRSERQLMREVEVNVAYRWFLGLRLRDKVPDASTLSQNRRRRFAESTIYQEIFDEIVLLAMNKGLASGTVLYTDSTHLKANANKNKYDLTQVQVKPQEYLAALEAAITEDRADHGKKPLKPSDPEPETKEIKVSRTDKDSGYMVRDGKPKGFFYLDHRTVDGRHAIITDSHVTPANVHDSVPYLGRLDRQRARFDFTIRAVGVDAGYAAAAITRGLEERNIYGVIGYRRGTHREGYFYKREYRYDEKLDVYICPNGQLLTYRTTNREGYRQYHSDPEQCHNCPVRQKCTQSSNATKVVTRHVWESSRERVDEHRLNRVGKRIYKRRKETVERSFADAKQLHGHRYARFRGLGRVQQQALLAATAQNIKKIALLLGRIGPNTSFTAIKALLEAYNAQLHRYQQIVAASPSIP